MDAELAGWCRGWLGAEPAAVLFRAGYLSEVTGLRLAELVRLAPAPASVPSLWSSPPWAAWDHDHPGLWPPPDDRDGDLGDHPGPAWLDRVAAALPPELRPAFLARGFLATSAAAG